MNNRPPLPFELLKDTLRKNGVTYISYEDLLWTEEWLSFRNTIKERDNFTCTRCGISQFAEMTDEEFEKVKIKSGYGKYFDLMKGAFVDTPSEFCLNLNDNLPSRTKFDKNIKLEVHHKYYIWNNLPWEYDITALTTLCDKCHEEEHFKQKEIYVDEKLQSKKELAPCSRCGGRGYIPKFIHVQMGICFNCGGLGGVENGTTCNKYDLTKKLQP